MSGLRTLRFHTLHIPFRERFTHASASRNVTSSVWVEAVGTDGHVGYGESCPRPYVTGETLDGARDFFNATQREIAAEIYDAETLRAWVVRHTNRIDRNPAAWCAIETALIDLFARQSGETAERWLGLADTRGHFRYTAVLGDAEPQAFAQVAARYREAGFTDFKVKLSGDVARDRAKLATLLRDGISSDHLRLDANNLWSEVDTAIAWLSELNVPAFAIEEALAADQVAALPGLARRFGMAIILDESLTRIEHLEVLEPDVRWIANVRVSKLGGLLRTLVLIEAARARGLQLIVGAQVGETSLLTRVALAAACAAGDSLIAQEGAFGTLLLEDDVCQTPLMFGRAGMMAFEPEGTGWGLACAPSPDWLGD